MDRMPSEVEIRPFFNSGVALDTLLHPGRMASPLLPLQLHPFEEVGL